MAAKKKTTKKTVALVNLNQEMENAILKACQGDRPPRTINALAEVAMRVVVYGLPFATNTTCRAAEQIARRLISSGAIVKAGGVYRLRYVGSENAEGMQQPTAELPESVEEAFGGKVRS